MTATKLTFRFHSLGRVLLPLLVLSATVVHGQTPAQLPLLTKAGAAVAPNVMLTLDDSGSMQFQHMPETELAVKNPATPNPVDSAQVRWDPADDYQTSFLRGTVPGDMRSANYALKALRSADTNTIFYNPEIRYQPWLNSDGVTRLPNSPIATAYKNPLIRTGAAGTYVDLTQTSTVIGRTFVLATAMVSGTSYRIVSRAPNGGTQTDFTSFGAANNNIGTTFTKSGAAGTNNGIVSLTATAGTNATGWCYANKIPNITGNSSGDGCMAVGDVNAGYTFTHDPGVYFRLNKPLGVYSAVNVAANYTGYSVNNTLAGFFAIGTQYKITTAGSTLFTSIGATSNLVGTVFTATGVGSGTGTASQVAFTKYPARTECLAAACTQAEEQQNYANWFSYYRSRNLLARGSLMEAFGVEAAPVLAGNFVVGTSYAITSLGSTSFTSIGASANTVDVVFTATGIGSGTGTARAIAMRLGFGRINKAAATVDGVSTKVLESSATYGGGGVRDFNFARKADLFKWLEDLPAGGGTPLVQALEADGEYYSRTDVQGPWTDFPALTTNVVADNKTCRRAYTMLTTDGYWNGAVGTAGDADGTAGSPITGVGASYTYAPVKPYNTNASSNTLADAAMKYWKTDLQPAMVNAVPTVANNTSFWQNMTVFTVGLGVKGLLDPSTDLPALTNGTKFWGSPSASTTKENVDDLWHAAVNSRGQYFSVKDPTELSIAIRTALAGATGGAGATAGVATASSTLTGSNRKYVPTFDPQGWNGDISSYDLDATGQAGAVQWTAASRMPAYGSRNVVTFDSTSTVWAGTAFAWASIPAVAQADMGTVATTNTTTFIDFLKGDHSNEGVGKPFRARLDRAGQPFVLGDIVNANPVLIQGNFDGVYSDPAWGGAAAYNTFKATKAARTAVLFAGSNDGMLHAFKDTKGVSASTDGTETFAYVPRAVYGNLSKLADKNYGTTASLPHQYFVDGPLAEADAYVKAPGATTQSWRNYLLGSLGAGGRAVFALDVTNTASLNVTSVRWELSSTDDADMGYVMSPIRVGVLPNGRWVAVFGNGFGSTGGLLGVSRSVLFVVDIEDAASSSAAVRSAAVTKLVLDSTGNNGLGGVTLVHDLATGRTTTIYVGDQKGKLWKLNFNPPTGIVPPGTSLFTVDGGAPFFSATDSTNNAQPITSSPAIFKHPSQTGGYMVLFGTGKLFTTADATDTSIQSVYGVWDKRGGPTGLPETVSRPMDRTNLVARTLTSFAGTGAAVGTTFYSATGGTVNYSGADRGWYMDLSPSIVGGRVVYPSQVVGYATALLSSVAPVQGNPLACETGSGKAINFVVPVDTGSNPTNRMFNTNGDAAANGTDLPAIGYGADADGVDAVVSSAAVGGGDRLSDVGGGGPVGDCTGDACGKKGKKCVPSPLCPDANTCLSSIQSATKGLPVCIPIGSGGTRIWRRIINPPIR